MQISKLFHKSFYKDIRLRMLSIKAKISSWNSTSSSFRKTRLQLFWHRYNRLIAIYSLVITYVTTIIVVFNLRSVIMVVIYGIILAVIGGVALAVLTVLFICSLFPKGRKIFDEWFNYSDAQLVTISQKLDRLEKRVKKIDKRVKKLEKKCKAE